MSEWNEYEILELCQPIDGGTPKTTVPDYRNGNIPWLSVTELNNGIKFYIDVQKKCTQKELDESCSNVLRKGQVIISARGTVGIISMPGNDMGFNQSC